MTEIWIIFQLLVILHFVFPLFLRAIAGISNWRRSYKKLDEVHDFDFAVIVTAYRQVDLIEDVVQSVLNNTYKNCLVYVVADGCDITSLKIDSEKVILLRPDRILGSNTASHQYAIDHFKRDHEIITILDSDNVADNDYLFNLNKMFQKGYIAVQGVRAARNLNTLYACLDEAGDMYYRYIDRKLLFQSGSSASLAGSGMAFISSVFKHFLDEHKVSGAGFDKVLQYELVKNNTRIAFTTEAVVYDGKTSHPDQLVKQRARWINTWFRFWLLGMRLLIKSLANLNWNQFAFSIMLQRPPLFLLLSLASISMIINAFINPLFMLVWVVALVVFIINVFSALSYFKADKKIYESISKAPAFIFYQIAALLKARSANKLSVATVHDVKAYKKE